MRPDVGAPDRDPAERRSAAVVGPGVATRPQHGPVADAAGNGRAVPGSDQRSGSAASPPAAGDAGVAPPDQSDAAPSQTDVVVLGGGVCGLYAGRTLAASGVGVVVLERREVPGGLAAGRERNGNYYDFGVHQLHAFDQEIFDDIQGIMGPALIPVEKKALIRYGRGFRRYPLEFFDLITGIPPWTLAWALTGLLTQQLVNRLRRAEPANAEEALVQLYGRPLYAFFFRDFTHRYWGIPPAELSASFVRQKMPRLSAVDVIKKVLGRLGVGEEADAAVESALKEETLWYSRTGAREMPLALADRIRRDGGHVLLNATVTGLEIETTPDGQARVAAVRYRRAGVDSSVACAAVLSTIPPAALVRACGPAAPAAVQAAAAQLRHKPVAVYGFLVRKERVLDALYVYYRDRIFHRLAEPANSGMVVQPPGHTVVLAETTCEVGDEKWTGGQETVERIIADMAAEGLLRAEEVVETHLFTDPHAYPVYALGFEPHLAAVRGFVAGISNLASTGRQGAFGYPNMHSAMRMGADAAAELRARLPARVAPAP